MGCAIDGRKSRRRACPESCRLAGADRLRDSRSYRPQRAGMDSDHSAGSSPACGGGVTAMHTVRLHRFCQVSGIISAVVLALLLIGTDTGRNALAWIYLQSTGAITNATHIHAFPLD